MPYAGRNERSGYARFRKCQNAHPGNGIFVFVSAHQAESDDFANFDGSVSVDVRLVCAGRTLKEASFP